MVLVFSALVVYMSVLFVVAYLLENNGVADSGYGGAFMVLTGVSFVRAPSVTTFGLVLTMLVFVWGSRLMFRIARKNFGKPEDFRYAAWRIAWQNWFLLRSYFQIYILQGMVVSVVALPVVLSLWFPRPDVFVSLFFLGCAVWFTGFFFESIADYQLDSFIKNPANKGVIFMSGLWKYSRHPNYFGESCMWIGIALASSAVTVYPFFCIVSPVLITYLLLYVSGVPLLEARWKGNSAWEVYAKRTSVFVPLPPMAK